MITKTGNPITKSLEISNHENHQFVNNTCDT